MHKYLKQKKTQRKTNKNDEELDEEVEATKMFIKFNIGKQNANICIVIALLYIIYICNGFMSKRNE